MGIYSRSGVDFSIASGFVRGFILLKLVNFLLKMVSQLISKCFMPFPTFLTTISLASGGKTIVGSQTPRVEASQGFNYSGFISPNKPTNKAKQSWVAKSHWWTV